MAIQPIDRKIAKHGKVTAVRNKPAMVVRSNKSVLLHTMSDREVLRKFGDQWYLYWGADYNYK